MSVIIILFVFGIITMFSSFFAKASVSKVVALLGVLAALLAIPLPFSLNITFVDFYLWNSMTISMTFISLVLCLFIILNAKTEDKSFDWPTNFSLLLFSTCGAVLLFGSNNLLTLFLGIEILSIPLYVLTTGNKFNQLSLEAGVKYFILGSFSSAFLLFGIALIYGTFGTLEYQKFLHLQNMYAAGLPMFFYLGMLFVLSSVFFKMSLVPFHVWSPDVYEGSHTWVTAYMATIVKIAASVAMYLLLYNLFKLVRPEWMGYLSLVIIFSLLIGNIMGLVQNNVKRMMAYSSISHAAFIAASIVIAGFGDELRPAYFLFYLISYTIASLVVFLISYQISDTSDVYLENFNGFYKKNPILSLGLFISMLSMAGIPLTAGFIAKFNVLKYMYDINIFVFIAAIIGSAIGMAYYLKVINHMYFYKESDSSYKISNVALTFTVIFCSVVSLVFGLFPSKSLEFLRVLF